MGRYRFLFFRLNLWLCLASGLMVAITAVALSVPVSSVGAGLLLPPLLFYFIYVEERRNVSPEDEVNHPLRTRLVRRHSDVLLLTELVALVGYEALLVWSMLERPERGIAFLGLGQLPFLVLALYGHLKSLPSVDSLAVGATWTFVVPFSLLVATPLAVTRELGLIALAWFLIVFAGVESRNVPDADGDSGADRTTLAAYLGPRRTAALVVLLKSTGVLVFWAISGPVVAGLVVGHLLLLRLFRALTRRESLGSGEVRDDGSVRETPRVELETK